MPHLYLFQYNTERYIFPQRKNELREMQRIQMEEIQFRRRTKDKWKENPYTNKFGNKEDMIDS